jgi:hypothetical protein
VWDVLRNAVTTAKDALGIELPELPVDAVTAAAELVPDLLPDLAGAGDAAAQALTDAGEAVTTAVPDVKLP